MAKLLPIPPLPEMASLFAFIAFLQDTKAVQERAELLEGYRNAINEKIELVGKAEEIDALRAQAGIDRQSATRARAEALEEAAATLADARAQAQSLMEAAQAQEVQREAALKALEDEAGARDDELRQRAAALDDRAEELAHQADEATRVFAEGSALKQEYEDKLARLRAAGVA